METKNLGLVKAVFRQTSPPARTDVLWYDTINTMLKQYDAVNLAWLPTLLYTSGALTDGAPTDTELTAVIGLTPVEAGAGFRVTVKDTTGTGLLYLVESDGTDWFYVTTVKAL